MGFNFPPMKKNYIISISIGEKKFEEIVEWLKKNTEQKIP
jgi:hypothetical protein